MPDRAELEAKTRYDPSEVEPRIAQVWLDSGLVHAEPGGDPSENYSIAIPLPNVTGVLHMGHALNDSIQDCLIRYHRMRGQRTKWILGTDHAGIATQIQVERALVAGGPQSRSSSGARRSSSASGAGATSTAARSSSSSSAWAPRSTTTTSASRSTRATRERSRRCSSSSTRRATSTATATWSTGTPATRSAISDLEVEDREVTDTLYYIDYPLAEGSGAVTVATVRPETMLADMAIAVHPDDDRYARLVGEKAILPLVGRKLRIIADEYVKPEFGTGALKITPGHDPNDFEIGRRHGLPEISVIGEDGLITDEAPERFRGMSIERGSRGGGGGAARAGPARAHRALHARGAVLAALRRADRAVDLAPVVHADGRAGGAGHRRRAQRPDPLLARELHPRVHELDGEHPALGASPASCGGATGSPSGTAARRATWDDRAARGRGVGARPRRARHVVQLGAVPVRGARLAGGHAGAARLLSDRRAGHRAGTSSSCGSPG